MRFRVGQVVKVIDGPRRGLVTRVISELSPCDPDMRATWLTRGEPVHKIDARTIFNGGTPVAPPRWLEPLHDPSDFATLAELLRSVRGETEKERA